MAKKINSLKTNLTKPLTDGKFSLQFNYFLMAIQFKKRKKKNSFVKISVFCFTTAKQITVYKNFTFLDMVKRKINVWNFLKADF